VLWGGQGELAKGRGGAIVALAAATALSLGACTTPASAPDAGPSSSAAPTEPAPADIRSILLTDDDGWDADGIVAAQQALVAAGFDVTLVAPRENWSGAGQYTLGGQLRAKRPTIDPAVWWVDGTPVDSVRVGLTGVLEEPPDLVVSGINHGVNVGFGVQYSGTVGAASAAAETGIPAIAVSADVDSSGAARFSDAADLLVDVVTSLDAAAVAELSENRVLNINVPSAPSRGVREAEQARVPWTQWDYDPSSAGTFSPRPTSPAADKGTDVDLVRSGYSTITVLEVDRDGATGTHPALDSFAAAIEAE
jgi:5'-nucleotidase